MKLTAGTTDILRREFFKHMTNAILAIDKAAKRIKDLLAMHRLDISCEATLQIQIERIFQQNSLKYERELCLSPHDRIDFFSEGIGIEVKIKGSAKAIFRQCQSYCSYEQVRALILVTGRSMGLPTSIQGKPCYYFNPGWAWL
jgi:hypothetical protein